MNKSEQFLEDNPQSIAEMKSAINKFEKVEFYLGLSTDESLLNRLQEVHDSYDGDNEMLHIYMDEAIAAVLLEYGFTNSVKMYNYQSFWYA